jgi:glycosyltransferase involved in cell wall biosynthesis
VSVLLDLQGIQSRGHGQRGIARYLLELASQLQRMRPDPVAWYLLNPDLPVPATIEPLTHSGRLQFAESLPRAAVYHVGSPIDLSVPLERLWPAGARSAMHLLVTLYDLIPLLFREIYLGDPLTRLRYQTRLELLRRADHVLAISETTAADAVEQLGISPIRVTVVGAGVSDRFRPATRRDVAVEAVRQALPSIQPGYVLYTGGIEPRKNIARLLDAYAGLSVTIRSRHHLVIVCRVLPEERLKLERRLSELRLAGTVHFPGFVPDDQLLLLYQAAHLFVFPSLYEGYGFPVAEAIACGAPTIVSGTSALRELVPAQEAQFDPRSTTSIRDALERALTNDELRGRLRSRRLAASHTWPEVARRTVAVYEQVAKRPRRRSEPTRRRIAFVTPLPPQRSGVADVSYRLLSELARHCQVEAFVDGEETNGTGAPAPPGVGIRDIESFDTALRVRRYDRIFYCLGNSELHAGALALLQRQPGVVIAHEVRLTGLYGSAAKRLPEAVPHGFHAAVQSMYRGRIPGDVGQHGQVDCWEAIEQGIFMAREAISLSEAFLVHSRHAAQLAWLDAAPEDRHKIEVIPYGMRPPRGRASDRRRSGPPTVATFGIVSPAKQSQKVVLAWPFVLHRHPDARLLVIGSDVGTGENARLAATARNLGVEASVDIRGEVDDVTLEETIGCTHVAVQLRAASNGETSAAVARCLAAGTATIVTNIGSAAELPDSCVLKVHRDATPEVIAKEISALLADRPRCLAMEAAGRAYAASRTHNRVARFLYERYVRPDRANAAQPGGEPLVPSGRAPPDQPIWI